MNRAATALMVAVLAAVLSCGPGDRSGRAGDRDKGGRTLSLGGTTVPVEQLTGAVEGLCAARRQAGANLRAAEATFYDRSHETLHLIARELEAVDRPRASALLEAKQRVEADLSGLASSERLRADLSELVDATRVGLDRLTVATEPCPT